LRQFFSSQVTQLFWDAGSSSLLLDDCIFEDNTCICMLEFCERTLWNFGWEYDVQAHLSCCS